MTVLRKNIRIFIIIIGVFLTAFAAPAGAQPCTIGTSIQNTTGLCNPTAGQTLETILKQVVDFLFWYGVPFVVVFLIIAGFMFVTARGNEEQLNKAKTMLFWTIIGAAIIVGAKMLAEAVKLFGQELAK